MKKLLMIVMLIGVVGLAGVANAGVLDLSAGPYAMSSTGWGLVVANAFDNNDATKFSTSDVAPHELPPWGTSPGEWLWVDMGQDYELNSVAIKWTANMACSYTVRTLADGGGDHTDPTAYETVGTAANLWNPEQNAPNGRGETWETWDFEAGTVTVYGGTPPGSAVVDEQDPIGRYLMIHATLAGDNVWGVMYGYTITVDADVPVIPIPEPAGLGLIGLALLAVRRKRS